MGVSSSALSSALPDTGGDSPAALLPEAPSLALEVLWMSKGLVVLGPGDS